MKSVFDFNKGGENRTLKKQCFGAALFRQYFQKSIFVLLIIIFSICFSSCVRTADPRTEVLMGTVCTVNAYDDGTKSLYDELFARLHEIDETFSVTVDSSEISAINKAAGERSVAVSSDTAYVIKASLFYAELTGGAFDPTVGPLVKLWGINTDHARVPEKSEIDAALPLINWRDVSVTDDSTVMLKRRGMALDLGGIVKGYAADELTKILKARKVRRAIVDLGGNIFVFGKKKDGSLWRVGIKNPNDPEGAPAIVLNVASVFLRKTACAIITYSMRKRDTPPQALCFLRQSYANRAWRPMRFRRAFSCSARQAVWSCFAGCTRRSFRRFRGFMRRRSVYLSKRTET